MGLPDPRGQTMGEFLLESLATIVADAAVRVLGVDREVAKVLADEATTRFSDQFGGEPQYIPKGRVFRRSALYRQIYERFTGTNQRELAREFGFTLVHLYRILAAERERDRAERQKTLPGVAR